MNGGDLTGLRAALQTSGSMPSKTAMQLSSDAKAGLGEVLITHDGLADRPADVLATLLPKAAHGVAWHRGIKDTNRQGRYPNHGFRSWPGSPDYKRRQDSVFGWTQTDLRASAPVEYSGVLTELAGPDSRSAPPSPETLQRSAAPGGNQRPRHGIRTLHARVAPALTGRPQRVRRRRDDL